MLAAAILDPIEPKIALFDPLILKAPPATKHEVDWMTRCIDIAIRNFPHERSVAGRSSILTLMSLIR